LFYHFSGRYNQARTSFKQVAKIDSLFEEAYFNIGNTYIGLYSDTMSNYSKDTTLNQAIYYFEKAIDLNPNYVQAIYNLGLQYEFKGDKVAAKKLYLEAIDVDNNYSPALKAVNEL
jgi:tetratricopeptide (TPR) repeat protein